MTIQAIYENGVFRPTEPVDLPEHSPVTLQAEVDTQALDREREANAAIWSVLSRAVDAGDPGLSERHNEHQP
ncbi:MAG: antitoxin family protein [Candidatus Sumerlaeia bacterium]|nr:antitoxin family protein [Candidatus Sumerlaeia bacterium]